MGGFHIPKITSVDNRGKIPSSTQPIAREKHHHQLMAYNISKLSVNVSPIVFPLHTSLGVNFLTLISDRL